MLELVPVEVEVPVQELVLVELPELLREPDDVAVRELDADALEVREGVVLALIAV